jgi:type VII secretion protein EccB
MWSRREQHQAYKFLTRRIVSTVLSGEPETNELPMRRFGMALFSGIGLAVLVVAGFIVYGLMFPGGGRPAENVIILERETGAIYVYQDGLLHPVLNWASARLILGQAEVKQMSRTSLRDVPRGPAVGIPDAPARLPEKATLIGLPWSVCSAPWSRDGVDPATHLLPGSVPAGGNPLPQEEALLVTAAGAGGLYLLWDNHRFEITDEIVLPALDLVGVRAVTVSQAFLAAVPGGPHLAPISVAGAGERGPAVDGAGTTVGQLFYDEQVGVHYVMTRRGLERVGDVTAALWLRTGRVATPVRTIDVAEVLAPSGSGESVEPPGLPDRIPNGRRAENPRAICAAYRGDPDPVRAVTVEVYQQAPAEVPDVDAPPSGSPLADRVALPGDRGALVTPSNGGTPGIIYLVTDRGVKHPLGGEDPNEVKGMLGYEGVEPISVPYEFLGLIPDGTTLDPDLALELAPPPTAP